MTANKSRPDEWATMVYQAVFGPDVVEQVMVSNLWMGRPDEPVKENGTLPTHGEVILILRNGRHVRLWTSEWGGATRLRPYASSRGASRDVP